jgi:hypothetical protein
VGPALACETRKNALPVDGAALVDCCMTVKHVPMMTVRPILRPIDLSWSQRYSLLKLQPSLVAFWPSSPSLHTAAPSLRPATRGARSLTPTSRRFVGASAVSETPASPTRSTRDRLRHCHSLTGSKGSALLPDAVPS